MTTKGKIVDLSAIRQKRERISIRNVMMLDIINDIVKNVHIGEYIDPFIIINDENVQKHFEPSELVEIFEAIAELNKSLNPKNVPSSIQTTAEMCQYKGALDNNRGNSEYNNSLRNYSVADAVELLREVGVHDGIDISLYLKLLPYIFYNCQDNPQGMSYDDYTQLLSHLDYLVVIMSYSTHPKFQRRWAKVPFGSVQDSTIATLPPEKSRHLRLIKRTRRNYEEFYSKRAKELKDVIIDVIRVNKLSVSHHDSKPTPPDTLAAAYMPNVARLCTAVSDHYGEIRTL